MHLTLDGWMHKMLRSRGKTASIRHYARDMNGDKVWWTREASGPSHSYLCALASAADIFAKVDIAEILHLQLASYYVALLGGQLPEKGSHSEVVDGVVMSMRFEAKGGLTIVLLLSLPGRPSGNTLLLPATQQHMSDYIDFHV